METASRKKPNIVLSVIGSVLVAVVALVCGGMLSILAHLLVRPERVETMPEARIESLVYSLERPRGGSLRRETRVRLEKLGTGEPGVSTFKVTDLNLLLRSALDSKEILAGRLEVDPVFLRVEEDLLVAQVDLLLTLFEREWEPVVQAGLRFRTVEGQVQVIPEWIALNSLRIPGRVAPAGTLERLTKILQIPSPPDAFLNALSAVTVEPEAVTFTLR